MRKRTGSGSFLIYNLLRFTHKHSIAVIIITILLTAVMAYFASSVKMNPDVYSLIPADEESTRLMEKYGGDTITEDYLIIAVESEDPFTLKALEAFSRAIEEI